MSGQVKVTLGDHELPLPKQRTAYIYNVVFRGLESGDLSAVEAGTASQTQFYKVACALCPMVESKIPEHEFMGYASGEAMKSGKYDQKADRSPYPDEMVELVQQFLLLHGGQRVIDTLGPQVLRQVVTRGMVELS
jgi:hypothetical protein